MIMYYVFLLFGLNCRSVLNSFMKDKDESSSNKQGTIHGRYTRDITDFHVVIPRRVHANGSFHSFYLPHFYSSRLREKRSLEDHRLHYKLYFNDKPHHLQLEPNVHFTSPGMVIETRGSGANLSQVHLKRPKKHLCHYTGTVKGIENSRVALSGCDGLVGYIKTQEGLYYIEPKLGEEMDENGEHVHIVYRRSAENENTKNLNCAVKGLEQWWNSWCAAMAEARRHNSTTQKRSEVGKVVNRYIECLLVADLKFLMHNKNIDVEEYILTIMNMVSDFYHEASIGQLIDVVVVRIIYLEKEKEEIDLVISQDASKTLESFCDWQVNINPKDHDHPNHHDVAILLTRYDICASLDSCSLLGLAYVGTVCTVNKNCAINEDNGLLLAVVVAHEVGHMLGCAHDSPEESGCSGKAEDNSNTIMAPSVVFFTNYWSNCSREFIAHLIENQMAECLLDEPKDHNYALPEMPTGAVYGADDQCKFIFGNDYISADIAGEKFCEQLWCKLPEDSSALSNGDPVADGTSCGPNMWCYEEECTAIGERPDAINGEWGDWNPWSQCTRSCGGGIRLRERLCNKPQPSHHGRYCLGKSKEYDICNIQSCDESAPGFRDVQCSEFNIKAYKGMLHSWIYFKPPDTDPNQCALYCINEENVYMKLAPRVKDGTRCHLGTKDTCIHGSCVHVGCNWKINSKVIEDACGVCGGDGTHCRITKGLFNTTGTPGYVEFITIPEGATNIKVEEVAPSENMIAVSDADKKNYYLNGDYIETGPEKVNFGAVYGIYTKPEPEREEIHIKGPTKEKLVFHVAFVNAQNPGYRYSFAVLTDKAVYVPKYHWEFVAWDKCSARCGGGTEISKSCCVEERDGRVSDEFCDANEKPDPKSRLCNMQPCKTRWKVWKWGPCSGCIFRSGVRHRQVECVKENPNIESNDEIITRPEECCGDSPKTVELCNSSKPCPREKPIKIRRRSVAAAKKKKVACKNKHVKRSSLCDLVTGNSSTGIVQDPIAPDTVSFKVAPIGDCKVVNLTEQQMEEAGYVMPKEVIIGPIQEFHAAEAIKKIEEIHKGLFNRPIANKTSGMQNRTVIPLNATMSVTGLKLKPP